MKKLDLGQTITILANVGVIAGIVFLVFELQQSNRIAIASTEMGIRNGYSELNRGIYTNSDVAELMSKASELNATWSNVESMRSRMILYDIVNVWLSVETACDNDLAGEATCEELGDDIRSFVDEFPGLRQMWRDFLNSYPTLVGTRVYADIDRAVGE